jgi:hypothetical protein
VTLNNSNTVYNAGGAIADVEVETSVPFFITTSFTAEKAEFGLCGAGDPGCADGDLTINAASVSTDLDVQNTVTITEVTLDGVALDAQLDTQDNITFNIALLDITTGEHTLNVIATDAAGNEHDTGDIDFTVIARQPYEVAMNAGWNLISFPGTPADTDIDSVFPTTHPATDILTFDDGVWMVATRSGSDWEGTLSSIDGEHGYWVNTTSSQPVEALLALPSAGSVATLPSIPVEQGWNLVAVIDLAQVAQNGAVGGPDSRSGATYFVSLDWAVAYTYNSATRVWTRITATNGLLVENGQGTWVWANEDGTLIP